MDTHLSPLDGPHINAFTLDAVLTTKYFNRIENSRCVTSAMVNHSRTEVSPRIGELSAERFVSTSSVGYSFASVLRRSSR